jgi:membrane-bound metal-dependent hydrolase YbcI (DUF457 family)
VEPLTHALTSVALARAGQRYLPRNGMAMLVVAGVAPDVDYASFLGGAGAFLRFDRALLHSIPSSIPLACAVAGAFCFLDRRRPWKAVIQNSTEATPPPPGPLGFGTAFMICAIGITNHLLLDLASGVGVQLLWPFRMHWFAFDLLTEFDPWILLLLAAGLLLPMLFNLIGEEIGERKRRGGGQRGAIAALVLLVVYTGVRGFLHSRAVGLLESRDYHGRAPLNAGAFPDSFSPFEWRGVVSTDNTIEELATSLAPGTEFDPERSLTNYKPENSHFLQVGQSTAAAQFFLRYARFPLTNIVRVDEGYRFELRDVRFAASDESRANILLRIQMREVNQTLQIASQEFLFASSRN